MDPRVSVVILAAGLGTRMKSKTVKVLHKAGGLTVVEHVVRTAQAVAASSDIVVITGHQSEKVQQTLAPYQVRFALQPEPKGTGHAVKCAQSELPKDGLLLVLYGDAPLISVDTVHRLIAAQASADAAGTVLTTRVPDPTGYGRIVRDGDGNVAAIVEQKAASPAQLKIDEINSGIYCFRADLLWKYIDSITTNNPAGEYYLTDIVAILRVHGHPTMPLELPVADELLGINTRVELAEVDRIFRAAKVKKLMLDGVTVERPDTVTVDVDVTIGRDTVVESHARLLGATEIGEDCVIGAGSVLRNAKLSDGVLLDPYTLVADSTIGAAASVGPFARLRMNNQVGEKVHIGNFVELKNTHMGIGAKAGHLAYLGDATIGSKVNVGAGTITCNYDGVNKHRTVVGEGAFLGSNSTLVAPVEIGAGSYVAAASVVTDTVPQDALAIGRGRQSNKEGWAKVRRETLKKR